MHNPCLVLFNHFPPEIDVIPAPYFLQETSYNAYFLKFFKLINSTPYPLKTRCNYIIFSEICMYEKLDEF